MLLMAYIEDIGASREEISFFDTKCNNHIYDGNMVLFVELNETFQHIENVLRSYLNPQVMDCNIIESYSYGSYLLV